MPNVMDGGFLRDPTSHALVVTGGGQAISVTDPKYRADNTGATSASAAFVAAESDAFVLGRPLYAPAGTYLLSAQLTLRVPLLGDGKGKTVLTRNGNFDFTTTSGSKAAAISLSANATANATTLTFTDAAAIASISAGDLLILRSTVAWPSGSAPSKVGEIVKVLSKATNVLTLEGPINETYATADSSVVEKLTFNVGMSITGVTFQGTTASGTSGGVIFNYCRSPIVRDCEFKNLDNPAVTMNACVDWLVDNTDLLDLTDDVGNSRVGYGVNCNGPTRGGLMFNCKVHNVRHGFTTNGSAEGVPHNNTVAFCRATGSSSAMWDTHEEGRWTYFVNCEVFGTTATAFKARAPDTWIVNPQVDGVTAVAVISTGARTRVRGGNITTVGVGGVRFQAGADDGSVMGASLIGTGATAIQADSGVLRLRAIGNYIDSFSTGIFAAGSSTGHKILSNYVNNASNAVNFAAGSTGVVRDTITDNTTNQFAGAGTILNKGKATLVAGTVTITSPYITAASRIMVTVQALGTVAAPKPMVAVAAAGSAVITSSDNTDTSIVGWEAHES